MEIKQAEYVLSAVQASQYPQSSAPEIALVGRSNVGKSSFINKFLGRRKLAYTSSTPGKTQTLNFYKINNAWYFVDLPGYGFARVAAQKKSQWAQFIEEYLYERQQLVALIQIIDLRHPPSADDLLMQEWMQEQGRPCLVVATKADKLSRSKQLNKERELKKTLAFPVVLFSAVTGLGREEVALWLADFV